MENAITSMTASEKIQQIQRLSSMDIAKYESIFMEIAQNKIIERRVSNFELELLLGQELLLRDIDADFEFRVFDGNRMTDIGTDFFLNYWATTVMFYSLLLGSVSFVEHTDHHLHFCDQRGQLD